MEQNMIVIGCDPGLKGAIARIDERGAIVEDMPVADGAVDAAGLAQMIGLWKREDCEPYSENQIHAYVERVGAMPKQGVSSTFNFGVSFGKLLGVLAALEIPYTLVAPQVWKKSYRLSSDKEQSRARALELFPSLAGDLKRKKDEGRGEALLLAKFGYDQERGKS